MKKIFINIFAFSAVYIFTSRIIKGSFIDIAWYDLLFILLIFIVTSIILLFHVINKENKNIR